MPMILHPQAPLRPTLSVQYTWSGGPGAEVLTVEIVETVTAVDQTTGQETTSTSVIATIDYDFSALGPSDLWAGVDLPPGVPAWANLVVNADRGADGTLTIEAADWNNPNGSAPVTQPLPWE